MVLWLIFLLPLFFPPRIWAAFASIQTDSHRWHKEAILFPMRYLLRIKENIFLRNWE